MEAVGPWRTPPSGRGTPSPPAKSWGQAGVITGESAQDPHIHLEVLDGDQYLDPVKLIGS